MSEFVVGSVLTPDALGNSVLLVVLVVAGIDLGIAFLLRSERESS